ncbi:anti-sigma factor [Phytomonospora sp. NPDC050363]|uniref:anti-sigma factor n=1 Tax=Phytomonospora sp. NPDC050363 TaxID=3155642 RepID=UPI0033FC5EAF
MSEDVHVLVGAFALGAVDDIDRARVERHLKRCPSCAAEAAELTATAARLADATIVVPPERLRADVMRAVSRTRQQPPRTRETPVTQAPVVRRWRARTAVAVAAGIIAIGTAGVTYAVQEDRVQDARAQAQEQRAESDRIAAVLSAPDAVAATTPAADGGEIFVVRSASLDAAVVTRVGMPVLPSDEAYQLWLDVDGHMTDAGLMPEATAIVDGLDAATRVALSTEPAGGSPSPTHPVGIVNLT